MSNSTLGRPRLVKNPNESYQTNIIVCAAVSWAIGVLFVGLRFYTRGRILRNVLGAEDWTILVALVFSGATCAGMIEQAVYGLGKHMLDVDLAVMIPMSRAGWYTILWYMMSLLFTKVSILLLYIRILSYQHARYAVYAIMAIVVLTNGLWTFITVITACIPLQAFWDRSIPDAYCRPVVYWYANTGLHIATDVLLYVLPLPIIVNLHVKLRQKIVLYTIFALGFFVCSISVVRLWDLIEEPARMDFTYDNASISYLTVVEINAAIACACCMTLKPFCARFFPRLWGSRSVGSAPRQRGVGGGDVEAGGGGMNEASYGAGGLASPVFGRGPPTIGSRPSRGVMEALQQQGRFRRGSWLTLGHDHDHDHDHEHEHEHEHEYGRSDSHQDLLDEGDKVSVDSGDVKGFGTDPDPESPTGLVEPLPREPAAAHVERQAVGEVPAGRIPGLTWERI